MKVKGWQVLPLGRPPRLGEHFRFGKNDMAHVCTEDDLRPGRWDVPMEAVERREVEVEVPDPVPEWITRVCATVARNGLPESNELKILRAYRAHVEERAKAAAERMAEFGSALGDPPTAGQMEAIIREEFLK